MASVLVFQSLVGSGSINTRHDTLPIMKEHLMPTIRGWAENLGYDYKLYSDEPLGFFPEHNMDMALNKFRYFGQDYDYTIYIDVDIRSNTLDPVPLEKGITAAESHNVTTRKGFKEIYGIDRFLNSGLIIMDRESSNHFSRYFQYRVDNNLLPVPNANHNDGTMFNEYLLGKEVNVLGPEWNSLDENGKFTHFEDYAGKKRLIELYSQSS